MKKGVVVFALSAALAMGMVAVTQPRSTTYSAAFEVIEAEPGKLMIQTVGGTLPRGYVMEIEAAGDNDPGDVLVAILDDAGTPDDFTDDTINEIRWSGLCLAS